jgi:hypothetical protein
MLTEHKVGPGGKDKGLLQSIINFAATEAITNFNKIKDAPDSITPAVYDQLRYHDRPRGTRRMRTAARIS